MEEPISGPSVGPTPPRDTLAAPRHPAGRSSVWCLAILVFAAPVFFFAAFVVYGYATAGLVDGRWARLIITFLASSQDDLPQLLGARSRFVWLGLIMLYVPLMAFASAFSLWVIARRAGPHARPVAGGFAIAAIAVAVSVWLVGAILFPGCFDNPCGGGCASESAALPFSVVPYMGNVFCLIYDPAFVAFFRRFFAFGPSVHLATLMLFFAATLSLIVGPGPIEQWTIADLRQRVSDFLVILLLGSAILTHTALSELTLWGWLVEIADGWPDAPALRSLQLGSALYWGMCNSALMLLVFAPIGVLLARQARALARLHNEGAPLADLEAWEREHGVTLHGRALWAQLGGILAPLLTGALAFLFETVSAG